MRRMIIAAGALVAGSAAALAVFVAPGGAALSGGQGFNGYINNFNEGATVYVWDGPGAGCLIAGHSSPGVPVTQTIAIDSGSFGQASSTGGNVTAKLGSKTFTFTSLGQSHVIPADTIVPCAGASDVIYFNPDPPSGGGKATGGTADYVTVNYVLGAS